MSTKLPVIQGLLNQVDASCRVILPAISTSAKGLGQSLIVARSGTRHDSDEARERSFSFCKFESAALDHATWFG